MEKEVKISESVSLKDEETDDEQEKETPETPSSGDDNTEETEEVEEVIEKKPTDEVEIKDVDGETPREKALRLELTRQRLRNRQLRGDRIFTQPEEPVKKELPEEKKKILEKYDPQEIGNLKEVLEVMADDLGFVKKDEYSKESYQKESSRELNDFLDKHSEYLPENDKDNILWNTFQEEFSLYARPKDPSLYGKIFEKIHASLFPIKSESDLKKIEAQRQKAKVVSHRGSSPNKVFEKPTKSSIDPSYKSYMKGFSEEELKDIFGE